MQEKESNQPINPLEELKKIGVKRISEDTHILPSDIEAIINKEFNKLNKTKAFGFIRILEREYKLDLSEWKKEYQEYLNSNKKEEPSEIFITVKEEKEEESENKLFLFLISIGVIIIAFLAYYFFNSVWDGSSSLKNSSLKQEIQKNSPHSKELQISPSKEEGKTKDIKKTAAENYALTDKNETNETNKTTVTDINETNLSLTQTDTFDKTQEQNITKNIPTTFTIEPRTKVWAGVIFLDDYSKKQFLTDQNITLDPSKDFLIITGHGKIDIRIGEEKKHFDEGKKLYLLYKDKSLEQIDAETFKTINRGKSW